MVHIAHMKPIDRTPPEFKLPTYSLRQKSVNKKISKTRIKEARKNLQH